MQAARRQFDGFARLDFKAAAQLAHAHDRTVHRHLVDFDAARQIKGSAREAIGVSAVFVIST